MTTPMPGPMAQCQEAADQLRDYCESKFPVGLPTQHRLAITGETYTELICPWSEALPSVDAARVAAETHFNAYAADKVGTLYWRVVPEIARDRNQPRFAYYMRLLISDKPHKEA